jgi:glycosyltransferase involved in cell wall biosynthesis
VANLSNSLAEAGCDVFVLGGEPHRMGRELSGGPISWWPAPTVRAAVLRLGRLGRFDVVHTHMTAAETAATAMRMVTKGQFVTTRHFAARRGTNRPGRLAGVAIRRLVDLQLAVSHYVAAGVDGRSVVVNPGVPVDRSAPGPEREPVVLVAQRLEAEKHTDVALRAWQRSGLARSGWEMHLAGGGQQEEALRALARELGVAHSCRFLGPRHDLSERYHRASLFFASRPDEALGLAVMEAMAAGLPVVAAAGGGHLETVGSCPDAAMFPPDDVENAALQLRLLGADEERRRAYGNSLQTLQREHFDASAQAQAVLALYTRPARSGGR